jgi:hypothetical protein
MCPARPRFLCAAEKDDSAALEEEPKNPYQPPHTGRNAPMSEDKRAAAPEQM